MSETESSSNKDLWRDKLYDEAWRQYVHEDNLIQSRSNVFFGILAALFAVLAAVSAPIVGIGNLTLDNFTFNLGLTLFGCLATLIGAFSFLISANWKAATEAGREYVNLRWVSAAAIERLADVESIGIATLEKKWRDNESQGFKYYPFKDNERLLDLYIPSFSGSRGYASTIAVIRICRVLSGILIVAGLLIAVIGFRSSAEISDEISVKAATTVSQLCELLPATPEPCTLIHGGATSGRICRPKSGG